MIVFTDICYRCMIEFIVCIAFCCCCCCFTVLWFAAASTDGMGEGGAGRGVKLEAENLHSTQSFTEKFQQPQNKENKTNRIFFFSIKVEFFLLLLLLFFCAVVHAVA